MLSDAFQLGGWHGERTFAASEEVVFAQLLAVLEHLRFTIEQCDAEALGLVAEFSGLRAWLSVFPAGRFAASVEAIGENLSAVTAEYSFSYAPSEVSHRRFRRGAERIFDLVERGLAA